MMTTEVIRNCEFRFKCTKTWDSLEVTSKSTQRFCSECKRLVRYCQTPDELESAIIDNECVAIKVFKLDPSDFQFEVGHVDVPYDPKIRR
jgi:hypothetical protein